MKQFNVPGNYRSPLIGAVKKQRRLSDKMKKDFSPTRLDFALFRSTWRAILDFVMEWKTRSI